MYVWHVPSNMLEKCKTLLRLELMDPKTITYFVRAARIQGDFLEQQQVCIIMWWVLHVMVMWSDMIIILCCVCYDTHSCS